jgi:hypothetical protein
MAIEHKCDNCKHWLSPSCPEINKLAMCKIQYSTSPSAYINNSEFEIIRKLCQKCGQFTPKH